MNQDTYDLLTMCIGMASAAACGYLAGRQWRIKQLTAKLKKEIYESAKLDGAYEFIYDILFSSITKHESKDGHCSSSNGQNAKR
jgi:ABC-type glycerol-3-phosphate transport system permease component